jgi:phospholipase A1
MTTSRLIRCAVSALAALGCAAHAQNPSPMDIRACTAIETDSQRLACYDHATGRDRLPAAEKRDETPAEEHNVFAGGDRHASSERHVSAPMSLLDSRWELAPESKLGTFNVRGYKPVYAMPLFVTDSVNARPYSPNPDNTVATTQPIDKAEAKFQISFKTKVWQDIFGDAGDLWIGYTQSSRWQVYNRELSRPFRETDYEPEAMLVFDTHYRILGWDGRLLGIGFDHQSNGRGNPLSRSWNRIVGDIGFERDGWTLMLRPWWRINESRDDDDNPDIVDYMGHGELQLVREWNGQEFALMARHAFNGGHGRGAGQFTWSFPMGGNLRGYLEFFNGYGESLIDYNHNASYFGLGISLLDWY